MAAVLRVREGDYVMLNSGGPVMLVEYVTADTRQAGCVWSAGEHVARTTFGERCLMVLASREHRNGR